MTCSSHVKTLLVFEDAFIEAGERAGRLAAERASALGLTVPYSDGVNLVEVQADGSVRVAKPLEPVRTRTGEAEEDPSLLFSEFDPLPLES